MLTGLWLLCCSPPPNNQRRVVLRRAATLETKGSHCYIPGFPRTRAIKWLTTCNIRHSVAVGPSVRLSRPCPGFSSAGPAGADEDTLQRQERRSDSWQPLDLRLFPPPTFTSAHAPKWLHFEAATLAALLALRWCRAVVDVSRLCQWSARDSWVITGGVWLRSLQRRLHTPPSLSRLRRHAAFSLLKGALQL